MMEKILLIILGTMLVSWYVLCFTKGTHKLPKNNKDDEPYTDG